MQSDLREITDRSRFDIQILQRTSGAAADMNRDKTVKSKAAHVKAT